MRVELTPKQQQFFDYLADRMAGQGSSPSLRQAAVALGVSHAAVAQLVSALAEKGYIRRDGRYSRNITLLNRDREVAPPRWRQVPVIGRVQAGLPMYAQQEWDGTLVVDGSQFRGENLFALRVQGDSMQEAGILADDLVICEPRQYAENGEIVVALIAKEEATVKRFFLHLDHIELRPANCNYSALSYGFGEVLIQGKVVGLVRDRGF
ncbi:MAG: repressor LexA [Deltaproteobacteria bacterium RIFOXYD12_FULL_50_9]|nr:MAG: repressor LexA [Deltaproteobacteria bacterium RIFOXYD12_FULL_50_9]